jgi:hypothetical protein
MNAAGVLVAGAGVALAAICALAPNKPPWTGGFYRDVSPAGSYLFYENRRLTGADFVFTPVSSIVVLSALGLAIGGSLIWFGRRIRLN